MREKSKEEIESQCFYTNKLTSQPAIFRMRRTADVCYRSHVIHLLSFAKNTAKTATYHTKNQKTLT